jgi:enoyl-CoA hydratase/carnithine racemase
LAVNAPIAANALVAAAILGSIGQKFRFDTAHNASQTSSKGDTMSSALNCRGHKLKLPNIVDCDRACHLRPDQRRGRQGMSGDILYEKHGPLRLITIDRADKMNSLDFEANDALTERWREFAADDDARVAVITGAGDTAFCAGADLKTYTMAYARTPLPEFRRRYTEGPGFGGITRELEVEKPIVAAINGYAVSGGLELALACDVRFCAPHAEFGFQDVRWGFHPCDGGTVRLPRIVGLGHALEMILSGERIDADHAFRIGLVNRILPAEALLEASLVYAEVLASRAPLAQQFAKQVVLKSLDLEADEALRLESRSFRDLAESEDLTEGTTAFREKRAPVFKGR